MCSSDLYILTAVFGIAMIIIGSRIKLEGSGIRLAGQLAEQLALVLGPTGKWIFLLGFWGAVFSSLIGVWQSAPYLFADFLALRKGTGTLKNVDLKKTPAYRWYLVAIAIIPLAGLFMTIEKIQLAYATMGALFMPMLALTLLAMNTRAKWVGEKFRNPWWINATLLATLLLFAYIGYLQLTDKSFVML